MKFVYDVQIDPNMYSTDDNLIIGLFLTKKGMTTFILKEIEKLGVKLYTLPEDGYRIRHVPHGRKAAEIDIRWRKRMVKP